MPFFPEVSLLQLALIVGLAAFSGVAGGMAGYGTGALMPLVLVPLVGAKPVVPIIAISAMFTNTARITAFRDRLDLRRALIALVCAMPTCVLGAWLYTLLTGRGAAAVIGCTLIATVPLRRFLGKRGHRMGEKSYAAAAAGWGILVGSTTGAGVILLSLLMATGLEGAAVIATDAMVSVVMGVIKLPGVRLCRRHYADSAGDRSPDRGGRIFHYVPRADDRRAAASPCAHGHARCRSARGGRRHDLRGVPIAGYRYGHFTTGGSEERIDSTLPPVRRPKIVPRS